MLGDFALIHPPLTDLERAWNYANSQVYHDAVDVMMRQVSAELEEECDRAAA